jgi:hypothetical protein
MVWLANMGANKIIGGILMLILKIRKQADRHTLTGLLVLW